MFPTHDAETISSYIFSISYLEIIDFGVIAFSNIDFKFKTESF